MRFLSILPLAFLLQVSLCGQKDPYVPHPYTVTVLTHLASGEPAGGAAVIFRAGTEIHVEVSPATIQVSPFDSVQVSVSKTGWTFLPADTTLILDEGASDTLFVLSHPPASLPVVARESVTDSLLTGVSLIVDAEVQPGELPLILGFPPLTPFTFQPVRQHWRFAPPETTLTLAPGVNDTLSFLGYAPGELWVRSLEVGTGMPVTGVTLYVDEVAQGGEAPQSILYTADQTFSLRAERQFWTFTPADTSLALASGAQDSLVFWGTPPPSESGSLLIRSVDDLFGPLPGAAIRFDGILQDDTTPATLALPAGVAVRVGVELAGWNFEPVDTLVTLAAEALDSVIFRGAPAIDTLRVYAEHVGGAALEGVPILIDNQLMGATPAEFVLTAGATVSVALAEDDWSFSPADTVITLDPGADDDLVFAGYYDQHVVILDDFSNVACLPCPQSDEALWDAVGRAAGPAVPASFHVWWPEPNDPFYLYDPFPHTERTYYYLVAAAPDIYVDGVGVDDVFDSDDILGDMNARLGLDPRIALHLTRTQESGDELIHVTGRVLADPGPGEYRLHILLYETLVFFDAPNGMTEFHNTVRHAVREMPDGPMGISLTLDAGTHIDESAVFRPDYGVVDSANLRALAFVQEVTTQEILDAVVEDNGGH